MPCPPCPANGPGCWRHPEAQSARRCPLQLGWSLATHQRPLFLFSLRPRRRNEPHPPESGPSIYPSLKLSPPRSWSESEGLPFLSHHNSSLGCVLCSVNTSPLPAHPRPCSTSDPGHFPFPVEEDEPKIPRKSAVNLP